MAGSYGRMVTDLKQEGREGETVNLQPLGLQVAIFTCSAMNLNALSSLTHSYVSPRIGLNGLRPAR